MIKEQFCKTCGKKIGNWYLHSIYKYCRKCMIEKIKEIRHQEKIEGIKRRNTLKGYFDKSKVIKKSCENCGYNNPKALEIHRIKTGKEGGEYTLENIMVLCSNCHTLITKGELDITKIRGQV